MQKKVQCDSPRQDEPDVGLTSFNNYELPNGQATYTDIKQIVLKKCVGRHA